MSRVLLHIGYPKTGSNFLWQYFDSNPELFVEKGHLISSYIGSGEIIAGLVSETDKHYVLSQEQLSVWQGELDIVGIRFKPYDIKKHQKKTLHSLYAVFPDATVLIITRGFESAFRSMYWQYVSIGGILSFKDFQQQYSAYFADFYDYDFLISIYKEVYGNNVVILPFELLNEDPATFLAEMEHECGLPHADYSGPKANAAQMEKAESYRKLSRLIKTLIYPFPYSVQKKIYQAYSTALYQRKLSWLPDFFPEGELNISNETLGLFTGKAGALKNEKKFKPYTEAYFLA